MFSNDPSSYKKREVVTAIGRGRDTSCDKETQQKDFFAVLQGAPLGGYVTWSAKDAEQSQAR